MDTSTNESEFLRLYDEADEKYREQHYNVAIPLYQRMLEQEGLEVPVGAKIDIRRTLAMCYFYLEKYGDAARCNQRTLQLLEAEPAFGIDHKDTIHVRYNLARALSAADRLHPRFDRKMQGAVTLYEQNLALIGSSGRGSPGYAVQAQSLASTLVKFAKYSEAAKVYQEILRLPENLLKGPKDGNLLELKHMYAGTLYHLKRYEKSKALLLQIQDVLQSCSRSEAQKFDDLAMSVDRYLAASIEATNDLTLGASRASRSVKSGNENPTMSRNGGVSVQDGKTLGSMPSLESNNSQASRPSELQNTSGTPASDGLVSESSTDLRTSNKTRSQAKEQWLAPFPAITARRRSSPKKLHTAGAVVSSDVRRVKSDQALKPDRRNPTQSVQENSRSKSSQSTSRIRENLAMHRDPATGRFVSNSHTRNTVQSLPDVRNLPAASLQVPLAILPAKPISRPPEATTQKRNLQRGLVRSHSTVHERGDETLHVHNRHTASATLVPRRQSPRNPPTLTNNNPVEYPRPDPAPASLRARSSPQSSLTRASGEPKKYSPQPQGHLSFPTPDITLNSDAQITLSEPISQANDDPGSLLELKGSEKDADNWFCNARSYIHNLLYNGEPKNPGRERVRIAILDSGLAPSTGSVRLPLVERIIRKGNATYMDFTGSGEPWDDSTSEFHGTKCAALLMQMAPYAQYYVANVVKVGRRGQDPNHVAAALAWARENEVDIISMSFGWDQFQPQVASEIDLARKQHILLFAAASNDGDLASDHGKYPAWDQNVYCIYSCRGSGQKSEFNPRPLNSQINFMFPGEDIAILDERNRFVEGIGRLSWTSYATSVAAGTAALVLDLVRLCLLDSTEVESRLKQYFGMSEIFQAMSGKPRDEGHFHVRPWTLLGYNKPFPSPHNVNETHQWYTLMQVLGYLRKFGDYDKPLE